MKKSVSRRSFGGAALGALGWMALMPKHNSLIELPRTSTAPSPKILQQVVHCPSHIQPPDEYVYGQRWNRKRSRLSESYGAKDRFRLASIGDDL